MGKRSSSGNSKLVIYSNSSSSKKEEEHEIMGQIKDKKMEMKMGINWKPMGKCSSSGNSKLVVDSNSSSSKKEEEDEIIGQIMDKKMEMKMGINWKPMGKCSSGNSKLVIDSSSTSGKKEEEHEIITQIKNKKMKMDNKFRDSSSSIFDHYSILREILSRLPIKSLMRFKCVSKHWQFSICQDQGLIDLHFARSLECCPDLFIVVPSYTKVELSKRNGYVGVRDYKYKQSVLLGNLFESGTLRPIRTTVTRLEQESFCYTEILDPVNGLICFVNRRLAAVRILNPSTRESTPWIASSLRQNKKYNFIADYSCGIWLPTYFFGFDPVTKQHKVLCTWRVRGPVTRNSNVVKIGQDIQWADFCEVLTVGENTWRYIDEKVPFSYTVKFSVYANGFIYWGKQSIGIPEVLNAFDVGQEKFKVIQVPQEIRDKCKDPPGGDTFGPFDSLTDVGGHIALLQRWSNKVVKLWVCGDDTSIGSYSKWTEITVQLPFNWGGRQGRYPYFHGVAGEDRIIIESYPTVTRDIMKLSLYSYDWKEKTSTKKAKSGVVTELASASLFSKLASANLFRSFAASLWPVRKCRFRHNQEIEKVRLRLNVDVTAAPDSAPIPAPIESFTDMCLHESIMKDMALHKYSRPTSIQAQAIPVALNGRDLLGCAETGSGKTAAFVIPMIQYCLAQSSVRQSDGPLVLVLAPTREHAQKIEKEVKSFSRSLESFRTAIVVGGTNMAEQRSELRAGVNIVVATPERLIGHLRQGNTWLSRISFVVLDKADKMLDMGFEPQIREVMRNILVKHQTLIFSATMPVEIEVLAQKYLTDPVRVKVGKVSCPAANVPQMLQKAPESDKVNMKDSY